MQTICDMVVQKLLLTPGLLLHVRASTNKHENINVIAPNVSTVI